MIAGTEVTTWTAWGLRPTVLFVAAYAIVGALHEWAHAATAYLLGVPSTLFHFGVDVDRARATLNQQAAIGVAGPLFVFALGLGCWLAYRKVRDSRIELPLLYLAMFGMGTLFGNLISASFVGDFSRAAQLFQLPMPVRYGLSIVGALLLCGLSFLVGTELRKWTPAAAGGVKAMIGVVAVPAILGTAVAVLVYLPLPSGMALARIGESSFWIFAAAGTLLSRKQPAQGARDFGLGRADLVILLLAVAMVRMVVGGIALMP